MKNPPKKKLRKTNKKRRKTTKNLGKTKKNLGKPMKSVELSKRRKILVFRVSSQRIPNYWIGWH